MTPGDEFGGRGPFGAGHGPGEWRNYGSRRPASGGSGRRSGSSGYRPAPLGPDELDALFSAVDKARFVALDFETTGLDPGKDRIVEIGSVAFRLVKGGEGWTAAVEGGFSSLVNPGMPIPAEVSAIHGIDDLAVSSAPTFAQAASELFALIEGSILVAHNAPFDLGFLRAESSRCGLTAPSNPAWDTIAIARSAISGLPSYSLKALAAAFGISQVAAHRGDDDARVCMELFARCVGLLERKSGTS